MYDCDKFGIGFFFGIVVPMVFAMCGFWDLAFGIMFFVTVIEMVDWIKERKLEHRLDGQYQDEVVDHLAAADPVSHLD